MPKTKAYRSYFCGVYCNLFYNKYWCQHSPNTHCPHGHTTQPTQVWCTHNTAHSKYWCTHNTVQSKYGGAQYVEYRRRRWTSKYWCSKCWTQNASTIWTRYWAYYSGIRTEVARAGLCMPGVIDCHECEHLHAFRANCTQNMPCFWKTLILCYSQPHTPLSHQSDRLKKLEDFLKTNQPVNRAAARDSIRYPQT